MANAKSSKKVGLAAVQREARKQGATIQTIRDGYTNECRVEAPFGFVWACNDIHELVSSANAPWHPDYADLLSRMSHGISKCTDDECAWCVDVQTA